MQRTLALIISLLLLFTAAMALAENGRQDYRSVEYPGYAVTLAIPAQYETFFREKTGLTISLSDLGATAYVRLSIMPDDPAFNEAEYFDNTLIPSLRSLYVTKTSNWLKSEGVTGTYILGGRSMTGHDYTVTLGKNESKGLVAFDRWNGLLIRYEAYYPENNPQNVTALLDEIIYGLTGSTLAPIAANPSLHSIECSEQHFVTAADPSFPWSYDDRNGVTVYTEEAGVIPYIMIYQSSDLIANAYEYIREQYSPHMSQQYGDSLKSSSEYENYIIGGKMLPVGVYRYTVQGREVVMVRIYDSTGARTVVYTAKYIAGEGNETMKALDAVIRNFRSANLF